MSRFDYSVCVLCGFWYNNDSSLNNDSHQLLENSILYLCVKFVFAS